MNVKKHETQPEPEYRIPLINGNGKTALVDKDNYDYLMQWNWEAVWVKRTQSIHAGRYERGRLILMENVVMQRAGRI